MNDPIIDFINVLSDNEFKSKIREIPDEFDQKDELLAEIEFAGEIPSSMYYFELNGYSGPVDFEDFLEKNFRSFKIWFLSNSTNINLDLVAEINEQIILSKAALIQIKQSKSFSSDMTFISLIDLKISYCTMTLYFIDKNYNTIKTQRQDKVSSSTKDPSVYVFRIKKAIKNRDYKIVTLHKELKRKGYIDCSLPQFRKLFILDQKPNQSPDPIIWKCKTYYHFSYFIQCINRPFLAYSKNPSNNVIARKLFYSPEGIPFDTKKERFDSKSGKTQEVRAVFDKIMEKCDLIKRTTENKKPTF
jgi:hypothetical protein